MAFVVLDVTGTVCAAARMDGSRTIIYEIAVAKANTARAGEGAQARAVDVHVSAHPVAVRLAPPRGVELVVVRARQALVVADHVAERDAVLLHQPHGQPLRRCELARVAEDLRVARADVFDA